MPWHPMRSALRVLVILCALCGGIAGTQASEAPLAGTRIGEANNPGPQTSFDDSEAEQLEDDATDGHVWDGHNFTINHGAGSTSECGTQGPEEPVEGSAPCAKPWDHGITEARLQHWRQAEAAVDIKAPKSSGSSDGSGNKARHAVACFDDLPPFVATATFEGSRPGYDWKFGHCGLGYYAQDGAEAPSAQPVALVLADCLPVSPCRWFDSPNGHIERSKRPARRHRKPDGGQRRRRRRPKGNAAIGTRDLIGNPTSTADNRCPELDTVEASTRWWMPKGLWAIETCNGDS